MIDAKIVGLLVATFVAGSFVASPELRAHAANTVFSIDIVNGEVKTADLANAAVTAAKIKDGEVKAAEIAAGAVTNIKLANNAVNSAKISDNSLTGLDIATDAIGGDEISGVSKLLFSRCASTNNALLAPGAAITVSCTVLGTDPADHVLVTRNLGGPCYTITKVDPLTDQISMILINACGTARAMGTSSFSIVVFDK